MKSLIAAILLLTIVATAHAQMWENYPKTVTITSKGETVGTATISGRFIYLRNKAGEHYATVINEEDGSKRIVDPHGKPLNNEMPIDLQP